MSDPLIISAIIAGLFTLAGSVLAIILAVLNRRDNVSQAAQQATVADTQNRLIERLQVDQAHNDAKVTRLEASVNRLEQSDGEKTARIHVLTEWGRWSTDPTPRTPPPWQREGEG